MPRPCVVRKYRVALTVTLSRESRSRSVTCGLDDNTDAWSVGVLDQEVMRVYADGFKTKKKKELKYFKILTQLTMFPHSVDWETPDSPLFIGVTTVGSQVTVIACAELEGHTSVKVTVIACAELEGHTSVKVTVIACAELEGHTSVKVTVIACAELEGHTSVKVTVIASAELEGHTSVKVTVIACSELEGHTSVKVTVIACAELEGHTSVKVT
ncbi:hypothetical protein J6590_062389 [Homalodisca vitripennis]|nr:hypothetical protein J6590_062389 [Homalodisca vitripennis]